MKRLGKLSAVRWAHLFIGVFIAGGSLTWVLSDELTNDQFALQWEQESSILNAHNRVASEAVESVYDLGPEELRKACAESKASSDLLYNEELRRLRICAVLQVTATVLWTCAVLTGMILRKPDPLEAPRSSIAVPVISRSATRGSSSSVLIPTPTTMRAEPSDGGTALSVAIPGSLAGLLILGPVLTLYAPASGHVIGAAFVLILVATATIVASVLRTASSRMRQSISGWAATRETTHRVSQAHGNLNARAQSDTSWLLEGSSSSLQ